MRSRQAMLALVASALLVIGLVAAPTPPSNTGRSW